jgi:peptidoglycan lytic transglycosylase D
MRNDRKAHGARVWLFLATAGLLILAGSVDAAPTRNDVPPLLHTLRNMGKLDFCGEPVPLHVQEVRERLEKELLLIVGDRPQVILWIKRASRFFPHVEETLRKSGLPDDLKYLAVIESALRPHAGSHKNAIGFWQFIRPTGRKYGLRIDADSDERRNLFASTRAAAAYLKDLRELLGSWTLAAAGYNMGEEGLQSEILAQKTTDYYRLYLFSETQRYVFRAIAAKLVMENPTRYGFHFQPSDLYPPLVFERVTLDARGETAIQVVAAAARTDFKRIKDLNPELRGHYLPRGRHTIAVPKGAGKGFKKRFAALQKARRINHQQRIYVVRRGDNLTAIAERFNVPLPALYLWNKIRRNGVIHPGDRLVVRPAGK